MLPVENVYGAWPLSGEIDIVESRGNAPSYVGKGFDWISSALHWGPLQSMDSFWRTSNEVHDKINGFKDRFHKFTLEWDEDYLVTCKS
jgi:beta-glucanase (GH16 family)